MRRRLIPAVDVQLGTASGGQFTYRRRASPAGADTEESIAEDDSPGTVEEPAFNNKPPPCTLAFDDE